METDTYVPRSTSAETTAPSTGATTNAITTTNVVSTFSNGKGPRNQRRDSLKLKLNTQISLSNGKVTALRSPSIVRIGSGLTPTMLLNSNSAANTPLGDGLAVSTPSGFPSITSLFSQDQLNMLVEKVEDEVDPSFFDSGSALNTPVEEIKRPRFETVPLPPSPVSPPAATVPEAVTIKEEPVEASTESNLVIKPKVSIEHLVAEKMNPTASTCMSSMTFLNSPQLRYISYNRHLIF